MKGGFRDRHFNWGSILLGAGVLFSVTGAVNTYIRTEKLFPGPHLYAGVGMVSHIFPTMLCLVIVVQIIPPSMSPQLSVANIFECSYICLYVNSQTIKLLCRSASSLL